MMVSISYLSLLEQLKAKKVTDAITILHFAKSKSLKKWKELVINSCYKEYQ